MIVEHDHPRERGVRGLKVRIGLVQRVPDPIRRQRRRLAYVVLPRQRRRPAILVDVVAEVEHEIEIFGGHVLIRREEAHLVVLARRDAELQPAHRRLPRHAGARAADRAEFTAGLELIPVPLRGLQAVDVDVDRMPEFRLGERRAGAHDVLHRIVRRHRPLDGHAHGIHAAEAIRRERRGREARPQHDAIAERIARRDAQREGIGGERLGGDLDRIPERVDQREPGESTGGIQKPSSVDP